mgnify:FL=1
MQSSIKSKPIWIYLSLATLFVLIVALNHFKMDENDTWWNIAMGRWMVQNLQIYRTEVFSATGLGRPFIAHEWLSEIIFYLLSSPTGEGLSYFKLVAVMFCFGVFGLTLAKDYLKGLLTYPLCVAFIVLISF